MYCSKCYAELKESESFCSGCGSAVNRQSFNGVRQEPSSVDVSGGGFSQEMSSPVSSHLVTPDQLRTSPLVARVLSFLLIGLGQMINGQPAKGALMFIGAIVISVFTGGLASLIFLLISVLDAGCCAERLQKGHSIGKFSFFFTA